ncbi:wall-associated receptor kinase 2-like [Herrania umbratica]|uniref:Wall-associated receptor kinase 2-like n=1 Tax=Herrania umbratica TaxID=108875 RepID=A0A6J1AAE8_9ROSI|nr:wall-associated receptor kinase 2-like [Herrania umbratica]
MATHKRLAVGTLVWLVLASTATTTARAHVLAKPGCPAHCGNLSIPYPFGTREGCFLNENFRITCNDSANSSTAFLGYTNFAVTNISTEGRLQILATVARDCYKASGEPVIPRVPSWFPLSIFNVSNTRNKFTAIGCDTYAYLNGFVGNKSYSAGCMSLCDRIEDVVDGSCAGFGCCQIQIPGGLKNIDVIAYSFTNHTKVSDFNLCSYAFVVEESQFEFSSDLVRSIPEDYRFPVSLDWVVGNETCEEAENTLNFTCHRSECYEPGIGLGYLCKCLDGYEGNPYLPDGCQDIDECKILQPCHQNAECYNSPGSFKCICSGGFEGDGKKNGTGCSFVHKTKGFPLVNVVLGASISILVLVLSLSWIYWGLWQRKLIRQRENFFQRNGGIILQQELSKHKGTVAAKIFTAEELKKATNNYHESR